MPNEFIRCRGVGVSATAIWEADDGRVVFQVTKDAALTCELCLGSPEQRPIISLVVGVVFLSPIIILYEHLVEVLRFERDWVTPRYETAMILLVMIGGWLVGRSVFRKRFFVRVATNESVSKLVFQSGTELAEIRNFLADAKTKFGWQIHDGIARRI